MNNKIEKISFINGIWTAHTVNNRLICRTKSYRKFKTVCLKYDLVLPKRNEIVGMTCSGHYFEPGGWHKTFATC